MLKLSTNLWFNDQAEEAAKFYAALFKRSGVGTRTFYGKAGFEFHGQPEGKLMTVEFELEGQRFVALNGGPAFKFTPAISLLIACESKGEVDAFWGPLAAGGAALMELGEYPFSEWYGWTQDRYGLSWQVMFMGDGQTAKQRIIPTLMFVGQQCGKTEEAIGFYASVFRNAKVGDMLRYAKGEEPDKEGTIKHAAFTLEGQAFAAMDSALEHKFSFNEAISFMVHCETQEEIDHYWGKLSAVPEAEQCGWLKDRYGLSWQIVPNAMDQMLESGDEKKVARVTEAFLKMKKFDIAALRRAYEGGK